jgi:phosphoribosylanthranilate isomerase
MMAAEDIETYISWYPEAAAFLLDAVKAGEAGGKGQTFNWNTIPAAINRPLILAGGLNPQNVAQAIQKTSCYAVDVSSGVESERGIKSQDKMREFVEQVNRVNESR